MPQANCKPASRGTDAFRFSLNTERLQWSALKVQRIAAKKIEAKSSTGDVFQLQPLAVKHLSKSLKFYTRWRRNSDPVFDIRELRINERVYEGELTGV